ncbi:hypothetical protein [Tautonia plasticadhaerens]|uniref:Uncharacterized protein n=1 Tax=Tautonia plasticadhaerens TaxID=2527974 RepID=A0A518HD15_9BACT|nr:hypothetical protein [Tautonia plasticadhaerens]QDV38730.1 hypothetical protein ElP_66860 [Tautonia plasticadhaerens]
MSLEGRSDLGLRRGRGGRLAAVGALLLLAALEAGTARGSELVRYSTHASVGNSAGVGFHHVDISDDLWGRSTTDLASPFKVADLVVEELPEGSGFRYHNMPFRISMEFFPEGSRFGERPEYVIEGVLNGGVSPSGVSDLTATLNSPRLKSWWDASHLDGAWSDPWWMEVPESILLSKENGYRGELWITPRFDPRPVPEPSSVLAWGVVGLGAIVARSRVRGRRAAGRGRGVRLAAVGVLAMLAASGAREGRASELVGYSTSGRIADRGGVGFNHVNFFGAWGPTALASPIKLGSFEIWELPANSGFDYIDMPFRIELGFERGVWPGPVATESDFVVEGVLNGGVTAGGASDLTATVTSVRHLWTHGPPLFEGASDAMSWLELPDPIRLVPGYRNRTDLWISPKAGPGSPNPVPEPISLVAWGAVGLGAVVVRSRRRGRAAAIGG